MYKCLFLAYRTLCAAVSGQLTYIYNGSVVSEGFQLNAGLQPSQIRVDCVLAEIRAANGFAAFVQKNIQLVEHVGGKIGFKGKQWVSGTKSDFVWDTVTNQSGGTAAECMYTQLGLACLRELGPA